MKSLLVVIFLLAINLVELRQLGKKTRSSGNSNSNKNTHSDNLIFLYQLNNGQNFNVIDKSNQVSLINENSEMVDSLSFDKKSNDQLPKFFSLLYTGEDYILIGTRNRILNVSLSTLNSNKASVMNEITWKENQHKTQSSNKQICNSPSSKHSYYSCWNYIREAVPIGNSTLLICGTNGGRSFCQRHRLDDSSESSRLIEEFADPQLYPPLSIDPKSIDAQTTFSFKHRNSIYTFNPGSTHYNAVINKLILPEENVDDEFDYSNSAKTISGAIKTNSNFRSAFAHEDKVFFFFKETDTNLNAKSLSFKTTYSMIGELCADDNGRQSNSPKLVSYKKTQIVCYLPDASDYHVKYTELQAVSKIISNSSTANETVFYGIFTFRRSNSLDSALCQFKISNVESALRSDFKNTENNKKYKYTAPMSSCGDYSNNDDYYKEINKHFLFQTEQPVMEPALFALSDVKFTSIVVDTANANNNYIDVIYIGTDKGKVLKLILRPENGNLQPILVQEMELFNTAINNMVLHHSNEGTKLVAISDEEIKSVLVESVCAKYSSCFECLHNLDPYCSWSMSESKCVSVTKETNSDVKLCPIVVSNENLNDSYSLNTESQASKSVLDEDYEANGDILNTLIRKKLIANSNHGSLFLAILLTAVCTSIVSITLTWLFIKKRYKMADYVSKRILHSSSIASNRSSTTSASSYNHYNHAKKFLDVTTTTASKLSMTKTKCQNVYETPTTKLSLGSKSDVSIKSPIRGTDSPTTTTTSSGSSYEPNNLSPNTTLTKFKQINDILSSSDDSFEPNEPFHSHQNHLHLHANKRNYSSSILTNSTRLNTDMLNITTNLLSSSPNDSTHDSNI